MLRQLMGAARSFSGGAGGRRGTTTRRPAAGRRPASGGRRGRGGRGGMAGGLMGAVQGFLRGSGSRY